MTPLEIASKLIAYESVTPDDVGCQTYLASLLKELGFEITNLPCE